jgi:hypothetical protein
VNLKATVDFTVRRAEPGDVDDIAAAHLDSIRSIGTQFYPADIVNDWGARVKGALYLEAMGRGEVFFIAVGASDRRPAVLGFSSHGVDGDEHHVGVYVRGAATRWYRLGTAPHSRGRRSCRWGTEHKPRFVSGGRGILQGERFR